MKDLFSDVLKQDFASHAVLGRVLFGISFLILGIFSILKAKSLASSTPDFVPDMLAPVLVIVVGCVFVGAGFAIATGKAVGRGAVAIAIIWGLIAVFGNAFSSYFDVREFFVAVAFIGASLVIKSQASQSYVDTRHIDEVISDTPKKMPESMNSV